MNRSCQSVREAHNFSVQFDVKPMRLPATCLLQYVDLAMEPIDLSIMLKLPSLALRVHEDSWRLVVYCFRVRVGVVWLVLIVNASSVTNSS